MSVGDFSHAGLIGMLAGALVRVAKEQPIIQSIGPTSMDGFLVEFNGEQFRVRVEREMRA